MPLSIEALVESAPPLTIQAIVLEQIVSWSASEGFGSLGDFIRCNLPEQAAAFGLSADPDRKDVYPPVEALDRRALRTVVAERLQRDTSGRNLVVPGYGVFSRRQLSQRVAQEETDEVGRSVVTAEERNINLIEQLAVAGKLISS